MTPRALLVRLSFDPPGFDFLAGQAIEVGTADQGVRKPYSIACSPEQAARDSALDLLVETSGTRGAGPHLLDLEPGRLVAVDGPSGSFVFPAEVEEPHVLFVAGGTGIAPIRSMLWHAVLGGYGGSITLVHSARTGADLAFSDEFARLDRAGRITFLPTVTREQTRAWPGRRGRIDRALLAAALDGRATRAFLCGPDALLAELPRLLRSLGVAPEQIVTESWRRRPRFPIPAP